MPAPICRHFTHPVIALPAYPGPGTAPDPALVLGLIRQETEFDRLCRVQRRARAA